MVWAGMVSKLEKMEQDETCRSLPMTGEAFAACVQVHIQAGLEDSTRLIKQAIVRRHIVVQLIRMWRDVGRPGYQDAFRGNVFYRRLHSLI